MGPQPIPAYLALVIVLAVIAIYLLISIYRSLRGRKYKTSRILVRSYLYFILAFLLIISSLSLIEVSISAVLASVGIAIGIVSRERIHFFHRNGALYYRRSAIVLILWASSFVTRIGLEFFSKPGALDLLIVDGLLGFSAGLIVGEAHTLVRAAKEKRSVPDK